MKIPAAIPFAIVTFAICAPASGQDISPLSSFDPAAESASVFYPGSVSRPGSQQWDIAFTPDGMTLFFSTDAPRRIMKQHWQDESWSEPEPAVDMAGLVHGGVSVSPDGRFLYFSASAEGQKRDLYRLDLTIAAALPVRLTDTPLYGEISASFDAGGNGFMWTDTKRDGSPGIGFYGVRINDGELSITADLSDLQTGDTSGENAPFVDPQGRYILFANYDIAPDSAEDLFLSELRAGITLPPVSLGDMVNTSSTEGSPYVTRDGQYLLFASNRAGDGEGTSDYQIYIQPVAAIPALNAVLQDVPPATSLNLTPPAGRSVTSDRITVREGLDYLGEDELPFTGMIEDRYPGGAMQRRKHVVDGRVQGVWIEWYETGVPRFYSEWNNGLGHGTWIYFHENGEISERVSADNDRWSGVSEGWTEDGEPSFQSVFRNGVRTSNRRFEAPAED